ncbi:hypothetical protein KIN20_020774 [Parelaphostrongylus tenuis]|uniref:Uncharacterized protein n=1 Tax=Parelaphostrongylus tenuis TaxID=148309 RepID=A0AAD5N735_PARTN|nr:hypothetical protein KIN20_020774 [Parelaphostrongylus tenuis]
MNTLRHSTGLSITSLLTTISIVLGCGVLPAGQSSTRTFTVTGFSLPIAMVYTENTGESARVSGIASSKAGARAFVQRLVMQTVFDVLELQARSAFLPDAIISDILGQLTVNITYEPLKCQAVALSLEEEVEMMGAMKISQRCIIAGNTVTGICTYVMGGNKQMCSNAQGNVMITRVPANITTISGTLMTTNIIMANWPRSMWQSVLDRAVRMLASGPFGSNFFSASATVGGK